MFSAAYKAQSYWLAWRALLTSGRTLLELFFDPGMKMSCVCLGVSCIFQRHSGPPHAHTASRGLHEVTPLPCTTQGKLLNTGATSRGKFGCESSGHSDSGCSREQSLVQGWLLRAKPHSSGPRGRRTDPRGFGNTVGDFLFLLLFALVRPAFRKATAQLRGPLLHDPAVVMSPSCSNCRLPGCQARHHRSCPGQAANG